MKLYQILSKLRLTLTSTDKTCSIVNNVGRVLVKKKVLMFGSKDTDTISNSDIYDTYKDLYLSEEERKAASRHTVGQ